MDIKQKLIRMKLVSRILWLPAAVISIIMLIDSFTGFCWKNIELLSWIALGCEIIAAAGIATVVWTIVTARKNNASVTTNGLITDAIMRQVLFFAACTLDWLLYIR